MNEIQYLLIKVAEEASEVAQIACKANCFGPTEQQYPGGPTNVDRLIAEMNDLEAVMDMLVERGVIRADWRCQTSQTSKKRKVEKYMDYSRRLEILK